MSTLKPFVRITILSTILAGLLIFLGVKYHWGGHLKSPEIESSLDLEIPKVEIKLISDDYNVSVSDFNPELLNDKNNNTLLKSMNKEQVSKHCTDLFNKLVSDNGLLELAIANCVVSNYEEVFQNFEPVTKESYEQIQKKKVITRQCKAQFKNSNSYSFIEKELLSGICISDNLSTQ